MGVEVTSATRHQRSRLGSAAASAGDAVRLVGRLSLLLGEVTGCVARRQLDRTELVRNLYRMGVGSLPIVLVTAAFTGGIMVMQAAPIVERYGAQALLGWGAGFGTLREIAPLLTALMISGRVGAHNAAELGTMAVTEQLDALRALAIDALGFLIAPRCLAIALTALLATTFADAVALIGAAQAGYVLLGVEPEVFYRGLTQGLLGFGDVAHGLFKSVIFGFVIGLSSCHFGVSTRGGAPGVGRAVNLSVVVSACGIFLFDYVLSFILG